MKLSSVKELLSKISPWPWVFCESTFLDTKRSVHTVGITTPIVTDWACGTYKIRPEDGEFIAQSPEIIDQLVKQFEVAKEALLEMYGYQDYDHMCEDEAYCVEDRESCPPCKMEKAIKEIERLEGGES